MTSPAMQALKILVAAGVGAVDGSDPWKIQVGKTTETQHTQIVVYDTGGFTPNAAWLLDYPTIQVLIRGAPDDYSGTWEKSLQVKDVLLGLTPQDVDGDHWSGCLVLSDLAFIGYDESNRPKFSINFRLYWERATNALTNRKPLDYTGP